MEKINNMKDIFNGPVYDFLINESLNNRMGWGGNAGSIDGFTETDLENSKKGNAFIREFLMEAKPYNILETGTNYGSFSYTCYESLDDFRLYTCDNHQDNHSARCIGFINDYYDDNKVTYRNIHSLEHLNECKQSGIEWDLIWLDSTHTFEYLYNEMKITAQMKPKFIMVDDFYMLKDMQLAVFEFLKNHNEYRFYSYSNIRGNVGSIVILQRTEGPSNLNSSINDLI